MSDVIPLTTKDNAMIDAAWEKHKAAGPVAKVINNNQPGWTNIVETAPNVTLDIGTPLYSLATIQALAQDLASERAKVKALREALRELAEVADLAMRLEGGERCWAVDAAYAALAATSDPAPDPAP